jgi:hypothetical protein
MLEKSLQIVNSQYHDPEVEAFLRHEWKFLLVNRSIHHFRQNEIFINNHYRLCHIKKGIHRYRLDIPHHQINIALFHTTDDH